MPTQKQRLLDVLEGRPVDRPPVICPGGMMSAALVEVMDSCGANWPEAHQSASKMTRLALAMYDCVGLENLAVPFCMTVEAEALGVRVNMGTKSVQPRVAEYPFSSARELRRAATARPSHSGRMGVVVEAVRLLASEMPNVPTIGNLVGPITLATSLIEPSQFMREMYRSPEDVHAVLGWLVEELAKFGRAQVEAGADVVTVAEPTATGQIIGPTLFAEFAVPYLRGVVDRLQAVQAKVIVHICGDVRMIAPQLKQIGADAISVDEMVNLGQLRAAIAPAAVMGNVSAFLLERGTEEEIAGWCEEIGLRMADIVAPACGLVTTTPASHVRTLTETVKRAGRRQRSGRQRVVCPGIGKG